MSTSTDVLVIGGGPAGAATAARLAAGGLRVVLCERQDKPRPLVCGEFLSATATTECQDLGLDLRELGAHPITRSRIFVGRAEVTAPLPFTGYGLSRTRLDARLRQIARQSGAEVRTGIKVRGLERSSGAWSAAMGGGERIESGAVILASGKHELRGRARPVAGTRPVVGFKMHYQLRTDQADALGDAVELFLYDGGYAGLQRIEDRIANLCLIVPPALVQGERDAWAAALAHLDRAAPALRARLAGSTPLWPRPATIARVPYGYVAAADDAPNGLYPVGDQAAVIPSLAGEGIAIALRSARLAADAVLREQTAGRYLKALRQDVRGAMRRAVLLERFSHQPALRTLGLGLAALPGVLPAFASLTRLARAPAAARV